ncbi:hypothetical protein ACFL08_02930 [Patescibacteria group bacterium]
MTKYEKIQYFTSIFLRILIGVLIPISIWRGEYFLAFASIFVLLLTFLPSIIRRSFKVQLPIEIDFVLTVALYLHYFLGEYLQFYLKISWWDLFLHTGNSIVLGMVGFVFSFILLFTSRVKTKPFFVALFALFFSVFMGVIWEIFEFSMDLIFGFSMQKSGLIDTMTDLIVDMLGALFISILGFLYMKHKRPGIFHDIVMKFVRNFK